ncbi:MAG: hypothetical protein ABIQ60_08990, partial [Burkholderiaceae bacterium]
YSVTLAPAPYCFRYRIIPTSALDLSAPLFRDKKCLGPAATDFGTDYAGGGAGTGADSICANADWNVRGVVTDAATGGSVAINQGITVRVFTTDAINNCK